MTDFAFRVTIISKSLGSIDAGVLSLAAPGYDDITDTDGTDAVMAELKSYPSTGMIQWRSCVLPREDFGGVQVALLSKSVRSA